MSLSLFPYHILEIWASKEKNNLTIWLKTIFLHPNFVPSARKLFSSPSDSRPTKNSYRKLCTYRICLGSVWLAGSSRDSVGFHGGSHFRSWWLAVDWLGVAAVMAMGWCCCNLPVRLDVAVKLWAMVLVIRSKQPPPSNQCLPTAVCGCLHDRDCGKIMRPFSWA